MKITERITTDKGTFEKETYIENFSMGTREGLNAIRYVEPGKNRGKWISLPNDYQMKKYFLKYDVVITDDNGKEIYRFYEARK